MVVVVGEVVTVVVVVVGVVVVVVVVAVTVVVVAEVDVLVATALSPQHITLAFLLSALQVACIPFEALPTM